MTGNHLSIVAVALTVAALGAAGCTCEIQCGAGARAAKPAVSPVKEEPVDLKARLQAQGLTLPPAPKPIAVYIPAVRTGNYIFVSGQLPLKDGKLLATGPVPSKTSLEDAKTAARQCALNCLAIIDEQLGGDWSKFVRVVRVGGFVNSDDSFTDQPKVANGASELLGQLFGEAGKHARAAVGVNTLPLGASVEVEMLVEVK